MLRLSAPTWLELIHQFEEKFKETTPIYVDHAQFIIIIRIRKI